MVLVNGGKRYGIQDNFGWVTGPMRGVLQQQITICVWYDKSMSAKSNWSCAHLWMTPPPIIATIYAPNAFRDFIRKNLFYINEISPHPSARYSLTKETVNKWEVWRLLGWQYFIAEDCDCSSGSSIKDAMPAPSPVLPKYSHKNDCRWAQWLIFHVFAPPFSEVSGSATRLGPLILL